ncbi:MAG: tetratricopeptide repeat protein [Candidatus Eisenbacteria bacterium]|uniref:Tetratricopeptide repeat protein n=1 Tax=Eiseniibacteriota bacterium TaxID=2212470 RepID=A0A956SE94_UNCEI|nr:tetratricopeptide repeat protein [Candidatus Eisenbacteria bacterium]MCB9464463.1 tetratricopeptide repeat protein [Candidatus Eisenbacteria bacterium]
MVPNDRNDRSPPDLTESGSTWLDEGGGSHIAAFVPGVLVANRYRIDAFVGRGGMGEVFRAADLDLDVEVALKSIRSDVARHAGTLRRFKQEVLLARSVTHPNVCRIYDLGRDEVRDVSFLTMEYLSGETLSARIREEGPIAVTDALPIVRQLADALDAAHRAGIVHRDFKSSNVMLVSTDTGERAVVTDFGLAVSAELDPQAAAVPQLPESTGVPTDATIPVVRRQLTGTPAYMSPEQVRGASVGPASDLYSFGVVLFEIATGRLPFSGTSPLDIAESRLGSPPPPPSSVSDAGRDWEAVILRLLSLSPGDRYATGAEAIDALEGRCPGNRAKHSLPAEPDELVGRARELASIARCFGVPLELIDREGPASSSDRSPAPSLEGLDELVPSRLLTVLGPGGVGKTRLALRYGWESLENWSGGVWFCDLSEARSTDEVTSAVAFSLGVQLGKGDPALQLGQILAARGKALLLLDNFEQVAHHAEATLGRWLRACDGASFLVTSRTRLRLPGESVLDLEPLDPSTHGTQLLELRARLHRPGFRIDEANRPLAERITSALDGLPLAIELAAARLGLLNLEQLYERLRSSFGILSSGGRGRQSTLKQTLDWSWDLLQPWERMALAQASVFEGGFTLEAAEAILDLSGFPNAQEPIDVILSLIDQSWLRTTAVAGVPRFDMYEVIHEYATRRLAEMDTAGFGSGLTAENADVGQTAATITQDLTERRHGDFYSAMHVPDPKGLRGEYIAQRDMLHNERHNLIATCRRAAQRADRSVAIRSLIAVSVVVQRTGPASLGVELGELVIDTTGAGTAERAQVARYLGEALEQTGRMDAARSRFEESLAIHRRLGDRTGEAHVLSNLASLFREQGRIEKGRDHLLQALSIRRELGDRWYEGVALGNLGVFYLEQGRMEEAKRSYEEGLLIDREVGNKEGEAHVLANLAILHQTQGRTADARRYYEEALSGLEELGNRRLAGSVLGNLGGLYHEQGRLEEARRAYEEALQVHREVGNRTYEGVVLSNLAGLYRELGLVEIAQRSYGEALALHREVGNRRLVGILIGNLGELHLEENRLEDAERAFEEAISVHREVGDRRSEGSVQRSLADLLLKQGRPDLALEGIERASQILTEVGDQLELSRLHCTRCEYELARGNLRRARATLADAESIASLMQATDDSSLGRSIARLRQRIVDA